MVSSVNSTSSYDRTAIQSQIAQKLFKKLDSNNDGGIDKIEFSAISGSQNATDVSQIFSKMDTNGDSKIDESENASALQKLSEKMASAFSKMKTHKQPDPDQMFSKLDTNGDGGVDETEFAQLSKNTDGNGPKFSDIDTNGDGVIDKTENSDTMKNMGPPPGPPPSGGPGGTEKK